MHHLFTLTIFLISLSMLSAEVSLNQSYIQWPSRQSDNLVNRKDLQHIVELQRLRDGNAIIPFFSHKDPAIRARAAFAMASVQDGAAVPGLLDLLKDDNATVRRDAALALRQSKGKVDIHLIFKHLASEKDAHTRLMLMGTMGFHGNLSSLHQLTQLDSQGEETPLILAAIYYLQREITSPEAQKWVLKFLKHKDPVVREHAAYFFYTMARMKKKEPQISKALITHLNNCTTNDPTVAHILAYLSGDKNETYIPMLIDWFKKGKSSRIRIRALEAMKPFLIAEHKDIGDIYVQAVQDKHYQVASKAAAILATCKQLNEGIIKRLSLHALNQEKRPGIIADLLKILWHHKKHETVLTFIQNIPIKDEVRLVMAIHAVEQIPFENIQNQVTLLLKSNNVFVTATTFNLLTQRCKSASAEKSLAMIEDGLKTTAHPQLRSETLMTLADNLSQHMEPADVAKRFQSHYQYYLGKGDTIASAACLVIVGHSRVASTLPFLKEASQSKDQRIRLAAQGALSLQGNFKLDPVYFYEMKFAPILAFDWALLKRYGRFPQLTFETDAGNIVITMDAEQAPMAVQKLIQHFEAKNYNNLYIYRVEPNHVIQAGTSGNYGDRVLSEFNHILKEEHTMGLGDLGKDTGSQHIALTHLMRPHNEGKYTQIGRMISGQQLMNDVDKYDLIKRSRIETAR